MEYVKGVPFDTLSLSGPMLEVLESAGLRLSTPVQAGCIPPLMEWRDVIAKAPTGTGKTRH